MAEKGFAYLAGEISGIRSSIEEIKKDIKEQRDEIRCLDRKMSKHLGEHKVMNGIVKEANNRANDSFLMGSKLMFLFKSLFMVIGGLASIFAIGFTIVQLVKLLKGG